MAEKIIGPGSRRSGLRSTKPGKPHGQVPPPEAVAAPQKKAAASPPESATSIPPELKGFFAAESLDRAAKAFSTWGTRTGTAWDEFRARNLALPAWYDHSIDPLSDAYISQQDRLWHLITGQSDAYSPSKNELTPEVSGKDALARPGFYRAGAQVAGDHFIALGHLVKHSGIVAGDRVIEYGAGFGQISLTLARMGAIVDTVDVSAEFCGAITAQAAWFKVPLTASQGEFGHNPRPGQRYKLVLFYEAFHHCREFLKLIPRLRNLVADNGKILLAGEPILATGGMNNVYPWGLNLSSEAAAVMRIRGWYELQFQEDFLLKCFIRGGFVFRKHPGVISSYATVYEFLPRPQIVKLADWLFAPQDEATWHRVEPTGRWTKACSKICVDDSSSWKRLKLLTFNYHGRPITVRFRCGAHERRLAYRAGEKIEVEFGRDEVAGSIELLCEPLAPVSYGLKDPRALGIFVAQLEYLG